MGWETVDHSGLFEEDVRTTEMEENIPGDVQNWIEKYRETDKAKINLEDVCE